jgi:hypothetical protein
MHKRFTLIRMKNLRFIILIIAITFNIHCTKKMNPVEPTENTLTAPLLPQSNLNINLRVPKAELNNTLNYLVNNAYSDGFTIEDGYKIHTSLSGDIDMQALSNQIITTLPLHVDITPGGYFRNAKVSGIISVQLTTTVEIFQNQLLNKTTLTSHHWIKKPIINILGLNIPIEPVANMIVKKYKTGICQSIDQSIQKNLNLESVKNAAVSYFKNPLYSTEDNIIHVFASPLELALGPMTMTDRDLNIPLIIYFESVIAETKPDDLYNDPSFSIRPFMEDKSTFYIQSRVPLPYIEQILREQIENQQFGSGISRITVHKVAMSGLNKSLSIHLDVSGAYNGKMEMSFDPVFDKDDQEIKLENFNLKTSGVKAKNIIFKLVKGFAENKLRKTVEDQINTNLKDYLTHIEKMLVGNEITNGVFLSGKLLDYQIRDIRFYNYRMYFNIVSTLNMNAEVKQINTSKLIFKKS